MSLSSWLRIRVAQYIAGITFRHKLMRAGAQHSQRGDLKVPPPTLRSLLRPIGVAPLQTSFTPTLWIEVSPLATMPHAKDIR
jgi:hypothetical protein